jgi:polysaccharide export outer membrane protein
MRTISRSPILLLLGVLAGAGCASQATWTLPQLAGGPDLSTAVAMGRPIGLEVPEPRDEGTAETAEAREDDAQQVVWRASSHLLGGEPAPADDSGPVVSGSRHHAALAAPESAAAPVQNELPRELNKVAMPPYRIEPPDVLVITALRLVPKPPYRIEPLDELTIQAPPAQVLPNEPISGAYAVGPDGQVNLGYSYGKVAVAGLTPEQARAAISKHIADVHSIKPPAASVSPRRVRGAEPIHGEHAVRMDGTVGLGGYGDVFVAGLTLAEAKAAVEAQLAHTLVKPEVTVDIAAANSKVYYVICDACGGQQVLRRPLLGGETVLDAVSELRGLPPARAARVWVARPVPGQVGYRQMLAVDWAAITEGGATNTNYQLFPGDRVYVRAAADGMALPHNGAPSRDGLVWGRGVSKLMGWLSH